MDPASIPQHCHHCGEQASSWVIRADLPFCCQGCAQVYEFLHAQNLENFYGMDQNSGTRIGDIDEREYELLKTKNFAERYIVFQDEQRLKLSWSLPNVHCRACVWLLEKLPELTHGVLEARVDMMRKKIDLVVENSENQVWDVSQTLLKLGYPPDLRILPGEQQEHTRHRREEWLQIGVAGFCFGNVMLFSFPEYLGGKELTDSFEQLFRILNILLSLPVMFYCAKGILLSGVKALRYRAFGVDVPISLGIVTLFVWSCAEVFRNTGSGYFDSLCGLVFFLLVGRSFQRQTFQNLVFERDEHRFFPLVVTMLRDGQEINEPLSELKSGCDYRISNGAMVPTDSMVISGEVLLDYRLVTGESELKKIDQGEVAYAGGLQKGGSVLLRAVKEVRESSLARMWGGGQESKIPAIESLLDRISKGFTFVVLSLAILTFFIWKDTGIGKAIELSCAVLIIACPCALALSAPLTLGVALRHLAAAGCYMKSAEIVEKFASLDTFIFDKTGTLTCVDETQGYWLNNGPDKERSMGRALAFHSNHPIAVSMRSSGPSIEFDVQQFDETPGCGMQGRVNGKVVKVGRGEWAFPEDPLLSSETVLVIDGEYIDTYCERLRWRDGVEAMLPHLSQQFDLHLISGDNEKDKSRCLQFFKVDRARFGQKPNDKRDYILNLVQSGRKVGMVGDGMNDALAMKAAHVGIAVPVGSGRFAPSSDVMVAESEFYQLENFLTYARWSVRIVVVCVFVSLLYNLVGLTAAMGNWITPLFCAILMPLSSFSVMTISVLLTSALARKKLIKKGL